MYSYPAYAVQAATLSHLQRVLTSSAGHRHAVRRDKSTSWSLATTGSRNRSALSSSAMFITDTLRAAGAAATCLDRSSAASKSGISMNCTMTKVVVLVQVLLSIIGPQKLVAKRCMKQVHIGHMLNNSSSTTRVEVHTVSATSSTTLCIEGSGILHAEQGSTCKPCEVTQ